MITLAVSQLAFLNMGLARFSALIYVPTYTVTGRCQSKIEFPKYSSERPILSCSFLKES